MEYSIAQAAAKMNLTAYTLRYYDKEGLLPFVRRSQSGLRRFTDEDLERIGMICCLKSTGMSIRQIREFVHYSIQGDETGEKRLSLLREHQSHVEDQMRQTQKHLEKVKAKINCLERETRGTEGTRFS